MIRGLSAGLLVLWSAVAPAAEEVEQLDAEFLEYLAHLEGDDDDWTLVAQPDEAQAPPATDSKKAESKTPKPSKQADPPAVDER